MYMYNSLTLLHSRNKYDNISQLSSNKILKKPLHKKESTCLDLLIKIRDLRVSKYHCGWIHFIHYSKCRKLTLTNPPVTKNEMSLDL